MLYFGIGNAGTRMLLLLYALLQEKYGRDQHLYEVPPQFFMGDADVNNAQIHQAHEEEQHLQKHAFKMQYLPLHHWWGGGCGVYSIIGELLAKRAIEAKIIEDCLAGSPNMTPASIMISMGGGTGGGVGSYLGKNLATNRDVRIIGILPELDVAHKEESQFEIKGPDDHQCASSGRLLVSFLNDCARQNPYNHHLDLFIASNSALTTLPENMSLETGMEKFNTYLANALMLMPSVYDYPPQQRLVTFGLGLVQCRNPESKESWTPKYTKSVAQELVQRSLMAIDFNQPCPTGISALPLNSLWYQQALEAMLQSKEDSTNHKAKKANNLRLLFQRCRQVDAFIQCRNQDIRTAIQQNQLTTAVEAELQSIFGTEGTPINVNIVGQDRLPEDAFPMYREGDKKGEEHEQSHKQADLSLVLLMDHLLVEDLYRLCVYYAQSSFDWQDANIDDLAQLLEDIIAKGEPGSDEQRKATSIETALSMLTKPELRDENPAYLEPNAQEIYPERLWGNIEELKYKVLQVLSENEAAFSERLLDVHTLAGAFSYLSRMAYMHKRSTDALQPTTPTLPGSHNKAPTTGNKTLTPTLPGSHKAA